MLENMKDIYKKIDLFFEKKIKMSLGEAVCLIFCVLIACLMFTRVFLGTELTDEAYYIADAIHIMHGNYPYAYSNYSVATGSSFLLIPIVFIYELITKDNEGILLYTRICFLVFWYVCLFIGYRVLKKNYKKSNVIFVTAFLMTYVSGCGVFNFSYNTVPCALAYVSGLLIYDATEHIGKYSVMKFIFSGFLMGIAVLAHPGYGIAIVLFSTMILIRIKDKKEKIKSLLWCILGGLAEMMLVFVPLVAQTGVYKLARGIKNLIKPYPREKDFDHNTMDKILSILGKISPILPVVILVFVICIVCGLIYKNKKEKNLTMKGILLNAVSISTLYAVVCQSIDMLSSAKPNNCYIGFCAIIAVTLVFVAGYFLEQPLLLYMGLYPIAFTLVQIFREGNEVTFRRFTATVPALAIYFLVMLENKNKIVKHVTMISTLICIVSMTLVDYKYIYRDDDICNLTTRVESGVYKGLYTTVDRAHDLPEMEKYLNSLVEDGETYAFRDNFPGGYLMMHNGTMLDMSTWDCLKYANHYNSPDNLYNYYQRRGEIPDKIIYVNYGRKKKLSIETKKFKYNEFVNNYYDLVEDIELNKSFKHIMMFENNKSFDGNLGFWIERHMYVPEEN